MATATPQTTTTTKSYRTPLLGALRLTERLTPSHALPLLGGDDTRSTLLPNAGELDEFLDCPDLALERYCGRTGADLVLALHAFRTVCVGGGAA